MTSPMPRQGWRFVLKTTTKNPQCNLKSWTSFFLLQGYIEQLHDLFHLEIKTYSTYVHKIPLLDIHWQAGVFHYNSLYHFFFFKRHFIKPLRSTSSPILITIFIPYGVADKKQCRFDNQKHRNLARNYYANVSGRR